MTNREELIRRCEKFQFVPGERPDFEAMTNAELSLLSSMLKTMKERGQEAKKS